MTAQPEPALPPPPSVMIFGCGYVGAALAGALLAAGSRVGALTRNPGKARALEAAGCSPVLCAALHESGWHAALDRDFDTVVNCVSAGGGGIDGYRQSYLEGQRSIHAWAEGRGIRCGLFTGSTSVYPQSGGVRVTEDSNTADAHQTAQLILDAEAELLGPRSPFAKAFVLRLAGIYGPGRHYLLDQLRSGADEIAGGGGHTLNLVHRDDIVAAILAAVSPACPSAGGIYNIADGAGASKQEVVAWLAGRLGVPPPRFNPEQTTRRLLFRGGGMPDRIVDASRARRELGWNPRYPTFREGYEAILREIGKAPNL